KHQRLVAQPAAFRPPALASWTILFPLGSWAFLTVGLPNTGGVRTPAGVATFHTRETRPGWTPSLSRDGGALPLGARPLAAPAASQRPVLSPRCFIPSCGDDPGTVRVDARRTG